jgi:hypothetical protein
MGEVEILPGSRQLLIYSNIVTYGNAASEALTELIRDEIETMWNEPLGKVHSGDRALTVVFRIKGTYRPQIEPAEIYSNVDPTNNYFRIEEFAHGNISFVDGLGCNTGYFKLENLYEGSTTAAHEYGHTLGLKHPENIDFRGQGVPGIMYPRGTLVDAQFQYNPQAIPGDNSNGGTMHPRFRKVRQDDIALLRLHRLDFRSAKAVLGDFTSIWHPNHADITS